MQRRARGQGCKLLHPGPAKLNLNLNPKDGGQPEKAFKERMRSDLWLTEGRSSGEREWGEGSQKVQTFSYEIHKWTSLVVKW